MGHMKDLDRRIRQGGDDAIAAVTELLPGFAVRTLPKGYEMTITPQPWISVRHQTPEHDTPVLVWFPGKDPIFSGISIARFMGEKTESGDCLFWFDAWGASYASHWMPLPEPPEVTK